MVCPKCKGEMVQGFLNTTFWCKAGCDLKEKKAAAPPPKKVSTKAITIPPTKKNPILVPHSPQQIIPPANQSHRKTYQVEHIDVIEIGPIPKKLSTSRAVGRYPAVVYNKRLKKVILRGVTGYVYAHNNTPIKKLGILDPARYNKIYVDHASKKVYLGRPIKKTSKQATP